MLLNEYDGRAGSGSIRRATRWSLALLVLFAPIGLGAGLTAHAEGPKRILLLAQKPDGHPKATHEYLAGQQLLAGLVARSKGLQVSVVQADDPWTDGPEQLAQADGVVLFVSEGAKWVSAEPRRLEAFAKLAERGGGLAVLHWGMGTREAQPVDAFVKLFGGCHGGPDRKYTVVEKPTLQVARHAVTAGIESFEVPREEFYYRLKWVRPSDHLTPLIHVQLEGRAETVCWAWERPDGGRSFGFSGLHFHENWKKLEYRRLLTQATLWCVRLPIPEQGLDVGIEPAALRLP